MIKVLHIQESVSFGGVERRRLSLAKNLDKSISQKTLRQKTLKLNIPNTKPTKA